MIGLTKSRLALQRAGFGRRWSSASRDEPSSSHQIRQQFLDFFVKDKEHTFVRSSPVVPFCDPTVAFVNAGMNQFKNVFLGTAEPRFARVANTQKCVRVGGKHNDLSVVGEDGYHHTFFEMMGNWSFGNYFKREACEYAWHLLTGPYRMDPNRLFVTYFAGDSSMGLEADLECRDIWRSIGVPDERILPFGAKDNFWEMGATGPCGPCTEIHYDHYPSDGVSSSDVRQRASMVNAGLPELTEIWNLVFIQYNRNMDKVISPLPQHHVDTGMGMERLTAVLQNATSNYTTDLFQPIFDRIQKSTKVAPYEDIYNTNNDKYNLYTSYRVVADHARMITACLSDGMFPDQNHKLRRVIRRVFAISDRTFNSPDLLSTIIPCIIESLGPTYPEMMCNQTKLQTILSNERETYRSLVQNASSDLANILAANPRLEANDVLDSPGFVPAFREFQELTKNLKKGQGVVPGEVIFKMYDTFGLREEIIERLAEVENLQLDKTGFERCLANARGRTKGLFMPGDITSSEDSDAITNGLAYTENELKYNYRFNWATREYMTPRIRVKVLGVQPVGSSAEDRLFDVVLDQSAFYPEGGGQESDQGTIVKEKNKLVSSIRVESVRMGRGGVLVHSVRIGGDDTSLEKGDWVELVIDNKLRTAKIFNHTATHLLNACVKRVTNSVTYQKSSSVTSSGLRLELAILGKKVDSLVVRQIQELVQSVIDAGNIVRTHIVDAQAFYTLNEITRIPGEVYPDRNVRIVSIVDTKNGITSREPCCGTHVANSREIEYFCITNVRHTGRGAYQFSAVTGRSAKMAIEVGERLMQLIASLGSSTNSTESDRILKKIQQLTQPNMNVPHHVRLDCQEILNSAAKLKREMSKATLRERVESEIQDLLTSAPIAHQPFLVHLLSQETTSAAAAGESVPLQSATKLCSDRPLIVACLTDGCVRARCAVPKQLVTAEFGAEKWLQTFATALDGRIADAQMGQNSNEIAVMKARKLQADDYNRLIADAVREAEEFAASRMIGVKSETPPVRWSDKG